MTLAVTIIVLLIGAVCLLVGFSQLRKRRVIQNIPTSKIRSAAMGQVEVKGTVHSSETYTAPLSGDPCVWYRLITRQYYPDGKGGGTWRETGREEKGRYLYLQDETGTCLLDLQGADIEVALHKDTQPRNNGLQMGVMVHVGSKRIRKEEYIITEGERLYTLANAAPNEDAQTKEAAPLRLGKGAAFFTVSDKSEKKLTRNLLVSSLVFTLIGAALLIYGIVTALA